MCGKEIKYKAIGFNDIEITGNSTILMFDDRKFEFFTWFPEHF